MKYIFMLLSLACFAQVKFQELKTCKTMLLKCFDCCSKSRKIGYTYSLENGSYSTVIEKTDYNTIQDCYIVLGYSPKKLR
jgi:hypothetical protein